MGKKKYMKNQTTFYSVCAINNITYSCMYVHVWVSK